MIVDMVSDKGLRGKVTWISFELEFLQWIAEKDPEASLGFISVFSSEPEVISSQIVTARSLMTGSNYVFLDLGIFNQSTYPCAEYQRAGVPVEVWVIPLALNDEKACLENLDTYITGVTANQLQYASPEVDLSETSFVFDGNTKTPVITVRNGTKTLTEESDYLVSYPEECRNAGKYSISVKLTEKYAGPVTEISAPFIIEMADNPLKVKGKTAKLKYSKIKKKSQILRAAKIVSTIRKGQGDVTY